MDRHWKKSFCQFFEGEWKTISNVVGEESYEVILETVEVRQEEKPCSVPEPLSKTRRKVWKNSSWNDLGLWKWEQKQEPQSSNKKRENSWQREKTRVQDRHRRCAGRLEKRAWLYFEPGQQIQKLIPYQARHQHVRALVNFIKMITAILFLLSWFFDWI